MTEEIPTFGGSEETLEEREKRWQKEKQGIIGDLSKEREARRLLEERLSELENPQREPEIQERIQQFTQDPDGYIMDIVEERVSSIEKTLTAKAVNDQISDALEEISEREGITKREAKKKYDEPLAELVKSRGLGNIAPYDGILNAYDIYQKESKDRESREQERTNRIAGSSSESTRFIDRSGGKRPPTPQEIANMTSEEYESHRKEILKAQENGAYLKK